MKKALFILALGSVSVLSANQYYQGQQYSQQGQYSQQPGYGYSYGSNPGYGYQGGYYQNQPQQQYYYPQGQGYAHQQYYQPGSQSNQGYYNQGAPGYTTQGYSTPAGDVNVMYGPQDGKLGSDQEIAKKVHETVSSGWFSKGYKNVSFDVNNGVVTLRGSVENADDKTKVADSVKKIDGVKQVENQIIVSGEMKPNRMMDQNSMMNQNPSMRQNQMMDQNQMMNQNPMGDQSNFDRSNEMRNDQSRTGYGRSNEMRNEQSQFSQDYAATESDRQLNAKIRDKLSGGWFGPDYSLVVIKTSNGVVTLIGSVDKPDDAQKANDTIRKIDGVRSVNNQLNIKQPQR